MTAAATSPLRLPCVTFLGQEAGAAHRPQGPAQPSRAAAPAKRRHAGRTRTQLSARSAAALPVPAGSCSSMAYGGCEGTPRPQKRLGTTTPRSSEAPETPGQAQIQRSDWLFLCQAWDGAVVWATLGSLWEDPEPGFFYLFFLN